VRMARSTRSDPQRQWTGVRERSDASVDEGREASAETALYALEWVFCFNDQRLLEPIGHIPSAEAEANRYRRLADQIASQA